MRVDKSKWDCKTLGEVCHIINGDRGKNYPSKNKLSKTGRYPFISALNIENYSISTKDLLFLSQEQYNALSNGKIKKGDIALCIRGSLGKFGFFPFLEGAIASSLVIARSKDILLQKYLGYYFRSNFFKNQLFQNNNGVAQPNIGANKIISFNFILPPLDEQKSIAAELDAIQAMIDGYREQLADLDALAQSIFLDTFGDPISNPKQWVISKMGKEGKIVSGSTPRTDNPLNWEGGTLNWVTPAELNNDMFIGKTKKQITPYALTQTKLTLLPIGAVLLSSRAPIGKVAITIEPMYCNQGFKNFVCGENINKFFAYFYLLFSNEELNRRGNGVTFKEISKKIVEDFPFPVPPLELQQQFATQVEAIEKQKDLLRQQIADAETLMAERMQYYFS